jgi:hypothetical protein
MIAFKDGLPVIQMANGRAVAFERDWLVRSLATAAERAGYGKWWLAEHVAESVTSYLRDQKEITVLPVEQLTTAVRSVLQVIGYGEVGQYFEPGPPKVWLSLVELAREAGAGYELAFFEQLRRRLGELFEEGSPHFELLGLESCVKLLRGRKVWCRDCDALRAEIVHFARQQAGMAAARHQTTFSLR